MLIKYRFHFTNHHHSKNPNPYLKFSFYIALKISYCIIPYNSYYRSFLLLKFWYNYSKIIKIKSSKFHSHYEHQEPCLQNLSSPLPLVMDSLLISSLLRIKTWNLICTLHLLPKTLLSSSLEETSWNFSNRQKLPISFMLFLLLQTSHSNKCHTLIIAQNWARFKLLKAYVKKIWIQNFISKKFICKMLCAFKDIAIGTSRHQTLCHLN